MSLQPYIDKFFIDPSAKEMAVAVRKYGKECESIIEYGSRGGVSGLLFLQALLDGKHKYKPTYVGLDLVNDDSIKNLRMLAEKNNIYFNFFQGHSRQFPMHEADAFSWDTFHCGGNLLEDLKRVAPYIHKYIFVLGVQAHGERSEALSRNVDCAQVAKELMITEEGVRMGLNEGLSKFLQENKDWEKVATVHQITILKRMQPIKSRIFAS